MSNKYIPTKWVARETIGTASIMNNIEQGVLSVHNEVFLENNTKEIANNNVTNFKVGTGAIGESYVDFSDEFNNSLVHIDNVKSSSNFSSIETAYGKKHIVNTYIKNIHSVDMNSKNYFDDAVFVAVNASSNNRVGNTISLSGSGDWKAVEYSVGGLTIGKAYSISCSDVVVTSGGSAIEVVSGANANLSHNQFFNTSAINSSAKNYMFIAISDEIKIRFHCTLMTGLAGNVTYKDVSVREVIDYIAPDLSLNSIPNGVGDTLENCILTKRVSDVINLKDLTWFESSTNAQFTNSPYNVFYAFIPDMKKLSSVDDDRKIIICNKLENRSQLYTSTADPSNSEHNKESISGHCERGEVRVKILKSSAPNLDSFLNWCSDTTLQFELAEYKVCNINLAINSNNGETIFINSQKPISLTHNIQFNTKSQIKEIQKDIQREKRSVLSKISSIFDCSYKFNNSGSGYIKLPSIFGGLIIQWGHSYYKDLVTGQWVDKQISLPTPFTTCFSCVVTASCNDRGSNRDLQALIISNNNAIKSNFMVSVLTNTSSLWGGVSWIAIGI